MQGECIKYKRVFQGKAFMLSVTLGIPVVALSVMENRSGSREDTGKIKKISVI